MRHCRGEFRVAVSLSSGLLIQAAVGSAVVTNGPIEIDDLREFCKETSSAFEIPKQLFIVDAFPLGSTGKVSRNDVRAMLIDG